MLFHEPMLITANIAHPNVTWHDRRLACCASFRAFAAATDPGRYIIAISRCSECALSPVLLHCKRANDTKRIITARDGSNNCPRLRFEIDS
jgi:hypothetical protein